jgi:hypothetical protein
MDLNDELVELGIRNSDDELVKVFFVDNKVGINLKLPKD